MQPVSRRSVLGLMAGAAAGVPAIAADARSPAALFANRPVVFMPRLSPDGSMLALGRRFTFNDRDETRIVVLKTSDFSQVSQIRLPAFHVPSNYWWVSNNRLVVAPGKEHGSLEPPVRTGELLAMDLDGSRQEYLYGYDMVKFKPQMARDMGSSRMQMVGPNRDGRFFITEHPWGVDTKRTNVYEVNSRGGARKLVADIGMPGASVVMSRSGVVTHAYGYDERALIQLMEYDTEKSEWIKRPTSQDGTRISPYAHADDGGMYVMVSKGAGPRSFAYQPSGSKDVKVIASHPVGSIDNIQWGPRALKPVVVASAVGIPEPRYPEPSSPEAQLHQALSAQFPGSFIDFESFSDDGNLILFSVTSDRNPGEFYLLDRKANQARPLFPSMPGIEPSKMAEQRPISFRNRSGIELHGYLTLPNGVEAKGLPMVLLPHGGPQGPRDDWFFDRDAQFLANRGYAVLQVNFRGSGGRGQGFESAGNKQWATGMIDDLVDGVRWAIAQGIADPKRIGSYGGSYGAYASMMVAIREPSLLKCAVGYAGLYDLQAMYNNEHGRASPLTTTYLKRVVGDDPAVLASQSPVTLADKVSVPVLLVHGEEDTITPLNQAKAFRDALSRANKDMEWIQVRDEWHGFFSEKNRVMFYDKLEAFLAKHMKA